ncbi:MAG: hypothetical protein ACFB10_24775 [Salibacteraceae bacterium]
MQLIIKDDSCSVTIETKSATPFIEEIHPDNLRRLDPSNPANPYDEIGLLHTKAMNDLVLNRGRDQLSDHDFDKGLQKLLDKYPYQSEVLREMGSVNVAKTAARLEGMEKIDPRFWLYPPTPEQEGFITPFLRDVIVWLAGSVHNFDRQTESIANLKKKFVVFEDDLMRSKLERGIRDDILIAMSVARHASYQYMKFFNQDTVVTEPPVIHAKKNGCCKKVARVMVADVYSAAKAYIESDGKVIHAIVGGIKGSAKQIKKEMKD